MTENEEVGLFSSAPDFSLRDPTTGQIVSSDDIFHQNSTGVVVMFICNHCPFVVHLAPSIAEVVKTYTTKGISFVAIGSNSIDTHPQDGPDLFQGFIEEYFNDIPREKFPYLWDADQSVAKAYRAACTPEFYVYSCREDVPGGQLFYHGQWDSSRPSKYFDNGGDPSGESMRKALDALLEGQTVDSQIPSIGCNIKWSPGNEPSWFGVVSE